MLENSKQIQINCKLQVGKFQVDFVRSIEEFTGATAKIISQNIPHLSNRYQKFQHSHLNLLFGHISSA